MVAISVPVRCEKFSCHKRYDVLEQAFCPVPGTKYRCHAGATAAMEVEKNLVDLSPKRRNTCIAEMEFVKISGLELYKEYL